MANNTTQPEEDVFGLGNKIIWNFVAPPLLASGLVGNLLIILVFSTSRNLRKRKPVLCITMITLACSDGLVFLFPILRHWLRHATYVKQDVQMLGVGMCKVHEFFVYFSLMLGTWMVVLVAAERFTIICFPLRRTRLLTTRRVICIIAAMVITSSLVNVHFMWTREFVWNAEHARMSCQNARTGVGDMIVNLIFPNVDLTLSVVLPFVLLFLFNSLIVHRLYLRNRQLKTIAAGVGSCTRRRLVTPTTRMLLPVPLAFIPLMLPAKVWLAVNKAGIPKHVPVGSELYSQFRFWWSCILLLQFCNFASNFFIYSMMSVDFRADLARLLCKCRGGGRQNQGAAATIGGAASGCASHQHQLASREVKCEEASTSLYNLTFRSPSK